MRGSGAFKLTAFRQQIFHYLVAIIVCVSFVGAGLNVALADQTSGGEGSQPLQTIGIPAAQDLQAAGEENPVQDYSIETGDLLVSTQWVNDNQVSKKTVVVIGPSDLLPDGLMRWVEGIERQGDLTTLHTRAARLNEAFAGLSQAELDEINGQRLTGEANGVQGVIFDQDAAETALEANPGAEAELKTSSDQDSQSGSGEEETAAIAAPASFEALNSTGTDRSAQVTPAAESSGLLVTNANYSGSDRAANQPVSATETSGAALSTASEGTSADGEPGTDEDDSRADSAPSSLEAENSEGDQGNTATANSADSEVAENSSGEVSEDATATAPDATGESTTTNPLASLLGLHINKPFGKDFQFRFNKTITKNSCDDDTFDYGLNSAAKPTTCQWSGDGQLNADFSLKIGASGALVIETAGLTIKEASLTGSAQVTGDTKLETSGKIQGKMSWQLADLRFPIVIPAGPIPITVNIGVKPTIDLEVDSDGNATATIGGIDASYNRVGLQFSSAGGVANNGQGGFEFLKGTPSMNANEPDLIGESDLYTTLGINPNISVDLMGLLGVSVNVGAHANANFHITQINPICTLGFGMQGNIGLSDISLSKVPVIGWLLGGVEKKLNQFIKANATYSWDVPSLYTSPNLCASQPIKIGDKVWIDLDGNGIQDQGEPGLQGATVTLLRGIDATIAQDTTSQSYANALVDTVTTDENGNYLFEKDPAFTGVKIGVNKGKYAGLLMPGEYTVVVTPPSPEMADYAYGVGKQDNGADSSAESGDASETGTEEASGASASSRDSENPPAEMTDLPASSGDRAATDEAPSEGEATLSTEDNASVEADTANEVAVADGDEAASNAETASTSSSADNSVTVTAPYGFVATKRYQRVSGAIVGEHTLEDLQRDSGGKYAWNTQSYSSFFDGTRYQDESPASFSGANPDSEEKQKSLVAWRSEIEATQGYNDTVDFGFVPAEKPQPETARISGKVYVAQDSGDQSAGANVGNILGAELGTWVSGAKVKLTPVNGTQAEETTLKTDIAGRFTTTMPVGDYLVSLVELPSGYQAIDGASYQQAITLTKQNSARPIIPDQNWVNFGVSNTPNWLSGVVFDDRNGNGIPDSGESALTGAKASITLSGPSAQSDENGLFKLSFGNTAALYNSRIKVSLPTDQDYTFTDQALSALQKDTPERAASLATCELSRDKKTLTCKIKAKDGQVWSALDTEGEAYSPLLYLPVINLSAEAQDSAASSTAAEEETAGTPSEGEGDPVAPDADAATGSESGTESSSASLEAAASNDDGSSRPTSGTSASASASSSSSIPAASGSAPAATASTPVASSSVAPSSIPSSVPSGVASGSAKPSSSATTPSAASIITSAPAAANPSSESTDAASELSASRPAVTQPGTVASVQPVPVATSKEPVTEAENADKVDVEELPLPIMADGEDILQPSEGINPTPLIDPDKHPVDTSVEASQPAETSTASTEASDTADVADAAVEDTESASQGASTTQPGTPEQTTTPKQSGTAESPENTASESPQSGTPAESQNPAVTGAEKQAASESSSGSQTVETTASSAQNRQSTTANKGNTPVAAQVLATTGSLSLATGIIAVGMLISGMVLLVSKRRYQDE